VRLVGESSLVVAPVASQRPAPLPARRPAVIMVNRPPREIGPEDATEMRGRIVDILV
jgi:hypothetical protein